MAKTLRKSEICSNCGQSLKDDNYCPACGQQNTTKNVSLRVLLKDFVDDYFTFDSRLFKSMGPLLFRPGFLTIEFNEGRRVKYIPPLRMYFIISIIYFLIPSVDEPKEKHKKIDEAHEQIEEHLHIDSVQTDSSVKTTHSRMDINTRKKGGGFNLSYGDLDTNKLTDSVYVDSVAMSILDSAGIEKESILGKLFYRGTFKVIALKEDEGKQFLSDLHDNFPTMMFFLLPVFALLLKMFYWRLKPLYVECVIFSLHFHSFVFVNSALEDLINHMGVFDDLVELIFVLLISIYLVIGLKKVFGQKYRTTIFKFFGLLFLYLLVVIIAFTLTFLVTLLV